MSDSHRLSEKRFENLLGMLLRAGVVLAATVVATGGVLYLIKYGATKPDFHIFRGEQNDLRSVGAIFEDAMAWHSRGLIQVGLLMLIATPITRVAFSVVAYVAERDWLYTAITMIVLGILVYSLTSA